MKPKLLVLTPILPQPSDLAGIAAQLEFLTPHYQLTLIDPLASLSDLADQQFYQQWADDLVEQLKDYQGVLGFSFGGMILQQCLPSLMQYDSPIILFSTPSFINSSLRQSLQQTLSHCQNNTIETGLLALYEKVHAPYTPPQLDYVLADRAQASARMCAGLQRALRIDVREILQSTPRSYFNFIGAESQLVNADNVIAGQLGQVISVPNAGMRLLENNLAFCQPRIEKVLSNA